MAGLINELLKAQAQLRLSKLEALIERGAQLFELYILLDAEGVLLLEGGVGFPKKPRPGVMSWIC